MTAVSASSGPGNLECSRVRASGQFSCLVVSNSLWPCGMQHTRLPCPSPTPGACSNSRPSSRWCHPAISSSVIPFSSRLQSFPASGSFPMSQLFASGGQRIGLLVRCTGWRFCSFNTVPLPAPLPGYPSLPLQGSSGRNLLCCLIFFFFIAV